MVKGEIRDLRQKTEKLKREEITITENKKKLRQKKP